jgi:hypothetical protein
MIVLTNFPIRVAAYFATSCAAGGKSDWFLGSAGEMIIVFENLQGLAELAGGRSDYWTSTQDEVYPSDSNFLFNSLNPSTDDKSSIYYVRPVRAF